MKALKINLLYIIVVLLLFPFQTQAGMQLVSCIDTGNCTVTDLLRQAVFAAQFLLGIAGSVFLFMFVLGGAFYVISFFDSSLINKGKEMMKNAAIGMTLMLTSWMIISYMVTTLGYNIKTGAGGGVDKKKLDTCSKKHKGYSCVETKGTKIKTEDCFPHLCKSNKSPTYLCCPPPNPTNNPD